MGRLSRRVAALVAPALLLVLPVPAASAAGTHTAVVLATQDGWSTYDAAAGATVGVTTYGSQVLVQYGGGTLRFFPPTGQQLAAGDYVLAGAPSATAAYVDDGVCGSSGSGTLHVESLTRTATGGVSSLSLEYATTCANRTADVQVRVNAPDGWWSVAPPWSTYFGTTTRGNDVARTIAITGNGTLPATLGAASLPDGSPFSVTDNRCDGVTLAAGDTCEVDVVFVPPHAGSLFQARLHLAADSPGGTVVTQLWAGVNQPPPAINGVRAVAGDDGIAVLWGPYGYGEYNQAVTGYRVYRDEEETPVDLPATATSYVDAAPPGTTRSYRVVAVAASGEGAAGTPVSATVPEATSEPGTVTVVAASVPGADFAGTPTLSSVKPGRLLFSIPGGSVEVTPGTGSAWAPGAFAATVQVGMPGGGCWGTGEMTVHEARVHADGTPVTLAMTGALTCAGGGTGHIDLRYAATRAIVAADVTPDLVLAGHVPPGTQSAALPLTVANNGTEPLELGSAAPPAEWTVGSDTCSGQTVAPGASCALAVRFAPATTGVREATLLLPDNTAAGQRRVRLSGTGGGPPSVPRDLVATGLARRVTLTWTPSEFAYPAIDYYRVQRSTSPTSGFVTIGSADVLAPTQYTDLRRTPGQRLYYRVAAVSSKGAGPAAAADAVVASRDIVYAAGEGDVHRLYASAFPGGTAAPAIPDEPTGTQEDPAVSPDGTTLLYTRDVGGRRHVFESLIHGTEEDIVATDRESGLMTNADPAWSADGKRIAFSCKAKGQVRYDLCVEGPNHGYPKLIPVSAGAATPSWLPNGRELLVVGDDGVAVVAADGSYRRVIPGTQGARSVAASPDGLRMAWVRDEGTEVHPGIGDTPLRTLRVAPLDAGPGVALTTSGRAEDPVWTADGSRVYYTHSARSPEGALAPRDVFSVPAAGGTPARVTDTPGIDERDVSLHDLTLKPPPVYARRELADFTGDGRADIAVFRPGTGTWMIRGVKRVQYGRLGDVPVAADYDGDRKADLAVFRPSTATWYVQGRVPVAYGRSGDIPVPADYNGDGRAEIAVFRPSTGTWHVRGRAGVTFGRAGDVPVPADYTGDRKADIAIYRPSTGDWLRPGRRFELAGSPAPADYAGIGRAQIAAYLDDGNWLHEFVYGAYVKVTPTANELAVYGNVDADRGAEPGVFNPALGLWRMAGRANVTYGTLGDIPV